MEYTEAEKISLMVACGVIVMSIAAVVAFFANGGGMLFYAIALITRVPNFTWPTGSRRRESRRRRSLPGKPKNND